MHRNEEVHECAIITTQSLIRNTKWMIEIEVEAYLEGAHIRICKIPCGDNRRLKIWIENF